jgi:hypothetical protein
MAKPQKKQVKKAEWKGYHKVNLSPDDAIAFEAWKGSADVQFSDFDVLANDGYKFSVAWDAYHEGISASLYCTSAKMEWAGYSLTAWAGDTYSAILLLFFKHFIICKQRWEIAPERSQNEGLPYG